MKPGSVLWLLHHELRLDLRRMFAKKSGNVRIFPVSRLRQAFVFGCLALLAHGVGLVFATGLGKGGMSFGMLLLIATFLALPSALRVTASTLFQSRDYELIGASPLPSSRVFAVRLLYLVAACWAGLASLLGATADVGLLMGASWAVPVWISTLPLAVILASLCLALGLSMSALIGARRAETLFHYLGVCVVLALMLGSQGVGRLAAEEGVGDALGRLHLSPGVFSPAAALAGDRLAMAGLFTLAGLCVILLFWRGPAVLLASAGAPRASRRSARRHPFAAQGLWLAWRKEWKLVLRTPKAAGEVLSQALSLTGAVLVLALNLKTAGPRAAALAGLLILAAAAITEQLVQCGRRLEQAPDLLLGAPLSSRRISAIKLGMAVLPGLALCLAGAVALAHFALWPALVCALAGPALVAGSGLIAFSEVPLVAVSAGFGGEGPCLAGPQADRLVTAMIHFVVMGLVACLLIGEFARGFLYAAVAFALVHGLILRGAWNRGAANGLFDA